MGNALWLNLGEMLRVNSVKYPHKTAFKDKSSAQTFSQLNRRVNKLSHLLLGLGLQKGDKISCFLENCLEIVELYLACAKTGIIINPINFRLNGSDVSYIINNADSKALFVHSEFTPLIESIRNSLAQVKHYFIIPCAEHRSGAPLPDGHRDCRERTGAHREQNSPGIPADISPALRRKYGDYELSLKEMPDAEPNCPVKPDDIWVLLYTSGTTGQPKGVLRSH